MKTFQWIFLFGVIIFTGSCKRTNEDQTMPVELKTGELQTQPKNNETVIANPVVYDVIIKNIDDSDPWNNERLKYVSQKYLVEHYLQSIYDGNLVAYDFFTEKPLSNRELRKIEKREDFSRNKIGKIQFYEQWYLDTVTHKIRKEVYQMVFGYHKFSSDSQVVGYKPIFLVKSAGQP